MSNENAELSTTSKPLPYATCTHIKDNGVICGSPAISGERYCHFHIRIASEDKPSPGDQGYVLPVLETEQSVQIALQQMMASLLSGKLSERKAAVMLSGIKAAASLIKQAQASTPKQDLLKEIASELCTHMPVRPAVAPEPNDLAADDWRQEA